MQKRELSDADIKNIKRCAASQRNATQNILENNIIEDQICMLTQEEFEKYPASLSLSQMFYENDIVYSYEEYLSHLRMTREYVKKHPNYSPHFMHSSVFRNIQITVHENEWTMISKKQVTCNPLCHTPPHTYRCYCKFGFSCRGGNIAQGSLCIKNHLYNFHT